jgi:hypothetical protein
MTRSPATSWTARAMGLLLAVLAGWLILGPLRELGGRHHERIWIEPGQYRGPQDATLGAAQVEAIGRRVQNLNY